MWIILIISNIIRQQAEVSMNDNQEWARKELAQRIKDSGLSKEKFARTRLIRTPSTVYRYLAGGVIPEVVCTWLLGDWRFLEDRQQEGE